MHSLKETEVNFFNKDKNKASSADLGNYDDSQIPVQLKKIIDHLGFLEKKLDTLLEQSRHQGGGSRPAFGNRNFSGGRGGHYRPNNREGFGPRRPGSSDNRGNDDRGNRYEGNRPMRQGGHSGRPFHKKYVPHTSHAPHASQGNTRETQ